MSKSQAHRADRLWDYAQTQHAEGYAAGKDAMARIALKQVERIRGDLDVLMRFLQTMLVDEDEKTATPSAPEE